LNIAKAIPDAVFWKRQFDKIFKLARQSYAEVVERPLINGLESLGEQNRFILLNDLSTSEAYLLAD
jgi:hypothetical protein